MSFKLTICIPTLNRGGFIGETLASIVVQLVPEVEVVIVDGGSTDDTERVIRSYQDRFPCIRYLKSKASSGQPSNIGFDRDCDYAVEQAGGEFCWLMTDDDIFKPGAIARVLEAMRESYSLIIASIEVLSKDLSQTFLARRPIIPGDRIYGPAEFDQFAADICIHLTFVGAVIIKKNEWVVRNRAKYYGTGFVHIGVIFQKEFSCPVLVISEPLISIRYGNSQWTSRAFQIWIFNWPELIWSFMALSKKTKTSISKREPWRNIRTLLMQRLFGRYSMAEYQKFLENRINSRIERLIARIIAKMPRILLLIPAFCYAYLKFWDNKSLLFDLRGG